MTLRDLKIGQHAVVTAVGGEGALRQHFLDMGIIPGIDIKLVKYAPMGDPMQVLLHGYLLTLRLADAEHIEVDTSLQPKKPVSRIRSEEIPHPGLGETGRYHKEDQRRRRAIRVSELEKHGHHYSHGTSSRSDEADLHNSKLTFALAGNQNCGKTTLFNQLTGANQHVGNFPGVTVDRKAGVIKGYPHTSITDLPGIYSLSPYTAEEVVSRQFILNERPSGIFNIVDATNIERNLYLTMQLLELGRPMVLALNMMDELTGNGGSIRVNEMEALLGIPVVPITASRNEGIEELVEHAVHVAYYHEPPYRQDFCAPQDHNGAVHRCVHAVMHLIERHAQRAHIPVRFAATKIIEGDTMTIEALGMNENERNTIEHIVCQMEQERGLDRAAAIADMRFAFIQDLCARTVVKPRESREQRRSDAIDRVLTGRWTAIPSFLLIMGLVFMFTFADPESMYVQGLGTWLQGWVEQLGEWAGIQLEALLTRFHVNEAVASLVGEGIFPAVTTVLTFLPLILVLFFCLSMLEDTGYLARVAFVSDKLLRKVGLSGRSIVPMLIGFGCSVPAVMSTRTLPSARDRKMTIMLTPFMSCTAKIPIYTFFASQFFPGHSGWVVLGMYVFGVVTGIVVAALTKGWLYRGEPVPFVMELPNYRMPSLRTTLQLMWEKARDFIYRAFTVIFLASIVIWVLQSYDWHFNLLEESEMGRSILASIAGVIAPLFAPLGFGSWQWVTALVAGFFAKETVPSTIEVLFPSADALHAMMDPSLCLVFLTFCLLYTPCVAAIASVRQELGPRWAVGMVLIQCCIAYLVALLVKLLLFAVL